MKYVLINADNLFLIQQNFPWLSVWFDRIRLEDDLILKDKAFILDNEDRSFSRTVLMSNILI